MRLIHGNICCETMSVNDEERILNQRGRQQKHEQLFRMTQALKRVFFVSSPLWDCNYLNVITVVQSCQEVSSYRS